jgi:thiamine biosynthesis lipoprotein
MGTRFELVLSGAPHLDRRALGAAGEAALERVHATEARWSLFLRTSRLAELNRSGHVTALRLDGDDLELFAVIEAVFHASGGAFDPNVARAMQAAGHCATRERAAQLSDAASESSPATWVFDPARREVSFTGPGPALDLGGVAKGHALDLAAAELLELGVTSALLHGGTSSVRALGAPPGEHAWRVRLGAETVELCNASLGVSRTDAQVAGRTGHIQIPGRGAAPLGREAAVRAPTAALADAWATALSARPTLAAEARAALRAGAIELLTPTTPVPT